MSKTHKTKPINVKVSQGLVGYTEDHDHRFGPCDLPELSAETGNYAPGTNCRWRPDYADSLALCGCNLCTGHYSRLENNKRNRKEAKRVTRNWTRDPESYDEEVIQPKRDYW